MTRLDRLRELVRGAGSESATSSGSVTAGRNGVEPDAEWVAQALGGSLEPSPEGAYVVVRRTYEKDSRHGRRAIREYPVPSRELLGVLGGQSGGPSTVAETDSVVCLDLETTGLRGGAGTFAFVVGFGWFEQGAFRTHQFVLSQLSAERRMLQAAAEVVGRATTLLTFNGKSFDAPVMETRWALHRLPSPLEALRHVDLLHPARRLWRSDEGRLASLERAVLGLRRARSRGAGPVRRLPAERGSALVGADRRTQSARSGVIGRAGRLGLPARARWGNGRHGSRAGLGAWPDLRAGRVV